MTTTPTTDIDGIEGPAVVAEPSRLALDTIARVLGATTISTAGDRVIIYEFPSLTAVLAFVEIVDGRSEYDRITNPMLLGTTWRLRVSGR